MLKEEDILEKGPLREERTEAAVIQLLHPKIVSLRYVRSMSEINIETAKEAMAAVYRVGGKSKCALLAIPKENVLPTAEAREFMQGELAHFSYTAMVMTTLAHRILANFMATLVGKTKLKVFGNEAEAYAWLLSKVDEEVEIRN